jgi:hypothetical protein
MFEAERPWSVERVPGAAPNEVGFRLRVHKPVPADVITIVGDVVHNMRSAVDSVAFELARRHVGQTLTTKQERAASFPIKKLATAFEDFFEGDRDRRTMYGPTERKAMRCAQPFAMAEEMAKHGVVSDTPPEDDLRFSDLHRLHVISNIDKHRRLPVIAWLPEIAYWGSPEGVTYAWAISSSAGDGAPTNRYSVRGSSVRS